MEIEVPQDRRSSFEPKVVQKRQTFTGKLITACRTHDLHPLERAHGAQTKKENLFVEILLDFIW